MYTLYPFVYETYKKHVLLASIASSRSYYYLRFHVNEDKKKKCWTFFAFYFYSEILASLLLPPESFACRNVRETRDKCFIIRLLWLDDWIGFSQFFVNKSMLDEWLDVDSVRIDSRWQQLSNNLNPHFISIERMVRVAHTQRNSCSSSILCLRCCQREKTPFTYRIDTTNKNEQ